MKTRGSIDTDLGWNDLAHPRRDLAEPRSRRVLDLSEINPYTCDFDFL